MQPNASRGHDAEIPSAAPESPEELGILSRVTIHNVAVGQNDSSAQEIVARHSETVHERPVSAAQHEASHPDGAVVAYYRLKT